MGTCASLGNVSICTRVCLQGKPVSVIPEPAPLFNGIPSGLAADITSVWMFFQLFGECVRMPAFGLDEFAQAVMYPGGDTGMVTQVGFEKLFVFP